MFDSLFGRGGNSPGSEVSSDQRQDAFGFTAALTHGFPTQIRFGNFLFSFLKNKIFFFTESFILFYSLKSPSTFAFPVTFIS